MSTTINPSSVLDTVTTNNTPPTCRRRSVIDGVIVSGECGKVAAAEFVRTCCSGPVAYLCADHLATSHERNLLCRYCGHVCELGVCHHRIVNPL